MNKQQLASTIWESANQMRSKIEANEYKDFILGFIFYKYLSERELELFRKEKLSDEEIRKVDESDVEYAKHVRETLGYFISYNNLFSTWLEKGSDFDIKDVRDALSDFDRNIDEVYNKVFAKIFNTLQTGMSKLGETSGAQTKSVKKLLRLIKKIPMDGKQDYDVLGFIYEYLISNFAANAGKKAGEFYTPHEVSVLMSEIVAEHLKDKKQIKIYDPTSGSGSLLINIGRAASKYITGDGKIDYYAQELKENTYNLTRMNLVMRGIKPANINVRNGDTLEDDWPFFEENKKDSTYELVRVDAVVSNPPYSQKWDPKDKEFDPRFKNYGVAPKTKADYAFLLHDLYHLNDDGIMTIVLPHGVLFRGGEEATIRENLVEKNNIDTIIGLPENIFFGTGIPTIIMVLKRNRPTTDILIIDASKGFEKAGKNNRLRDCDIKRIVDTVKNRVSVDKYSAVVSKNTIRENGYNLNIPRYVDSSDEPEKWDIGATMIGGIPNAEIDELQEYWDTFPGLRESIFKPMSEGYSTPAVEQIGKYVQKFGSVVSYKDAFSSAFNGFYQTLYDELIDGVLDVQIEQEKEKLASDIFSRVDPIPLIDRYAAYQSFAGHWNVISGDIEMLQTEGFEVITQVDPNMVIKKNNKEDDEITEVQDGWKGHILPFELVQTELLPDAVREIDSLERRLAEIGEEYTEIIDSFDEDEKQGSYLNDNNDAFVTKELKAAVDDALKEVTSAEIQTLSDYLAITSKKDKIAYIEENKAADWAAMTSNADGTYKKTVINNRIKELKQQYIFPAGSFESKIIAALQLTEEETAKKRELKLKKEELQIKTKEVVEGLSEDEALKIVELKWLKPLYNDLIKLPDIVINDFIAKLNSLLKKYSKPLSDIEDQTRETEMQLSTMIGELDANDQDMQGIDEFIKLIGGNTK
ncbi:type I restriction-modification system subunit M [Blautia massiliensis (ex Durand et al. 2017)]|uniref:type I restriction-modification system subunit M n=1 Tax=Blautia massiliensis (ex Durand et al. 2017) TaxID=1737424 RepID=UPI00242C8E8A|nr:type I restriction-modification system subunit M [Blautia massiliensis (ex Durand et al. 2017)]MDD6547591.1 type I restriction-modification system subunit M [Blautia massiliensis (ex Durand et al. 2017)]